MRGFSPCLTAADRFQSHRYFEAGAQRVRAEMRIRPALARRAAAVVRRVRAELGGGQPVKVRRAHTRPGACACTSLSRHRRRTRPLNHGTTGF